MASSAGMMQRCMQRIALSFLLTASVLATVRAEGKPGGSTRNCSDLRDLRLPNISIETAEPVPAGRFNPPSGKPLDNLPAFCRVAGVLTPTADSNIRFEVWLPAGDWNSKYGGVGNGGFAGSISYSALANNLRRGYATAATDTGHEGEAEDASWAYKHPERINDFGYRGLHETTEIAKTLIKAFYGENAKRSYFDSCSDGGREALMEAQRFPADFDGILAGAPANNWTQMLAAGIGVAQALYGDPKSYIPKSKLPAIGAAVRAACDANDGVKDGILNNPPSCHFDPNVLLCKGQENRNCLTSPQIESLKVLYGTAQQSGAKALFPGYAPGGEDGTGNWDTWIIGPAPGGSSGSFYMTNYFRFMVFNDPKWNPLTASVSEAATKAKAKTGHALDATDPNLAAFNGRGGKLILYHGWNDPAISPYNTINYYGSVRATMGDQTAQKFLRLYMVPGMGHCIGGPGPNRFGQLGTTTAVGPKHGIYQALEDWVENGQAPGDIVATKWSGDDPGASVEMTRPLCAYPDVAVYKGTGDTNNAASFSCAIPDGSGSPDSK